MGKETKVGLLVGMSFIICVAIVLSHRGRIEETPQPASFEIATVLSDAPVPPVRPEPREQVAQPRQRRTRTGSDEAPRPRRQPTSPPRIGETPPGLPPVIDTRVASAATNADNGDFLPRVAEALTRFTRRADAVPARLTDASDYTRPSPIVASRGVLDSEEPMRLTTPGRIPQRRETAEVSEAAIVEQGDAPQLRETQSRREYVIQPGDTLGGIAQKHYGTCRGGVVQAICDANPDTVPSKDYVVVGRTIVLPAIGAQQNVAEQPAPVARPVAAAAPVTEYQEPSQQSYEIQPGDTLSRIAKKHYGSNDPDLLDAIVDANEDWMRSADHIVAGRTLRLPNLNVAANPAPSRVVAAVPNPVPPVEVAVVRSEPASTGSSFGREGIDWAWYQLKKGDVYSTVAAAKLGTANRWRELAEMNADIFPDPAHIRWGVNIRVPLNRGLTATQRGDA